MKIANEWNISYAEGDIYGNSLDEHFIVLPSRWKVLWWFFCKGHRYKYISIWTSH